MYKTRIKMILGEKLAENTKTALDPEIFSKNQRATARLKKTKKGLVLEASGDKTALRAVVNSMLRLVHMCVELDSF